MDSDRKIQKYVSFQIMAVLGWIKLDVSYVAAVTYKRKAIIASVWSQLVLLLLAVWLLICRCVHSCMNYHCVPIPLTYMLQHISQFVCALQVVNFAGLNFCEGLQNRKSCHPFTAVFFCPLKKKTDKSLSFNFVNFILSLF